MPLPCPVCIDPELREAVDEALDAGTSFRDLANQYGGTKDTVARHRRHPRPPAPSPEAVALAGLLAGHVSNHLAMFPTFDLDGVRVALGLVEKATAKAFAASHAPPRA